MDEIVKAASDLKKKKLFKIRSDFQYLELHRELIKCSERPEVKETLQISTGCGVREEIYIESREMIPNDHSLKSMSL